MPWVLHRYVSHSELSLSPCDLPIHIGVCYGVFFLHLGTTVDAIFTYRAHHWGLQHCSPSEYTHGQHMYILVMV